MYVRALIALILLTVVLPTALLTTLLGAGPHTTVIALIVVSVLGCEFEFGVGTYRVSYLNLFFPPDIVSPSSKQQHVDYYYFILSLLLLIIVVIIVFPFILQPDEKRVQHLN